MLRTFMCYINTKPVQTNPLMNAGLPNIIGTSSSGVSLPLFN